MYNHLVTHSFHSLRYFRFFQFFVGNIPTNMKAEGRIFTDYVLDWHKKYGPVIKYQILDKMIVSTIDPNAIKVSCYLLFGQI